MASLFKSTVIVTQKKNKGLKYNTLNEPNSSTCTVWIDGMLRELTQGLWKPNQTDKRNLDIFLPSRSYTTKMKSNKTIQRNEHIAPTLISVRQTR